MDVPDSQIERRGDPEGVAPVWARLDTFVEPRDSDEATAGDEPGGNERHPLAWATRALVALSFAKVAAALTMVVVAGPPRAVAGSWIPLGFVILQLTAFAGAASMLLLAHARDSRTAHLGVFLIVVASAFSTSHVRALAEIWRPMAVLAPLYPDAFLAFAIGRFIQTFPARQPRSRSTRVLALLVRTSALAGTALFAINAAWGWGAAAFLQWSSVLQRRSAGGTVYWGAVFGLFFLTLPLAFVGNAPLQPAERRRVRLFWAALAAGFGPDLLIVVLGMLPGIGARVTASAMTLGWQIPAQLALASVPVMVAYAVLVRQLLPLRVVLRQAVQYLLARWTITAAFVVPLVALGVHAYLHRDETIAVVFGGRATWLLGSGALAGVALFAREDLRRTVDRWFFREAYDARRVLVDLGEHIRRAHRIDELVAMLTAGIDRALQPEAVAVLVRDPAGQQFVSLFGSVEPLSTSSVLAGLVASAAEPIDVRLGEPESPLRLLPRPERQWLVDSRSRLLVPLRSSDQTLVGLVTLADRKSELPFLPEDRWLLMAIADAGALTIENHAIRIASPDTSAAGGWQVGILPRHARAMECPSCGCVQPSDRTVCATCAAPVIASDVPEILFGKFRFEARVGRGAMGVVYRAHDLTLDRTVAIKTLPGTSPEHAERLRLEAKSMAAVMHRHLAIIYGAESWRGRPMLICEFMTHGTLDARLANGPLAPPEAIGLGISLAEALSVIHSAGLLHRDLKPSNIGYAHDRVPKILDFGLVHLLRQTPRLEEPAPADSAGAFPQPSQLSSLSLAGPVVGTPLYLSPEASRGHPPTLAFDLWSLHVLLLEAITGHHPFRGGTVEETLDRIQQGPVRSTFEHLRHISSALAAYFERALAREAASRPSSATEVAETLRRISRSL